MQHRSLFPDNDDKCSCGNIWYKAIVLTNGPSDQRAFGRMGLINMIIYKYIDFGLTGLRTNGPSGYWAFGLKGGHPMPYRH